MNNMRKIITIIAFCLVTCTLWAQNEVSLVVSGEGEDKEEATFKALRSAIEQAYGTFVSANTTILNDQLVADEIVSLSSGNIQKYEYVSENKMPNGNTLVTLSATVSIDKLVSFAESKGMEAELKGGLFAMNIKKMEFDKKAEEKAVENLCKQLESVLPNIIDYEIELGNPQKSIEVNEDLYEISFVVQPIISDKNREIFGDLILKTLGEICLSKSEMINYEESGIDMYGIRFEITPSLNQHPLYRRELHMIKEAAKYNKADTNYINFLNKYPNWYKKRMDSGSMVFRSKKTLESLLKFMNHFHLFYKNFAINDGSRTFNFRTKYYGDGIQQPKWLMLKGGDYDYYGKHNDWKYWRHDYIPIVDVTSENNDGIYIIIENSTFAYDTFSLRIEEGIIFLLNGEEHGVFNGGKASFLSNEYFGDHVGGSFHTFLNETKGKLLYPLNELSKITHISVSKPINTDNDYYNDPAPQESNNSSKVNEEIVQTQSKLSLYNDTLQQAVNGYNTLLKQYPYNYNENRIAYTLSSDLPDDDLFLRDTLHTLLQVISDKKAQLKERYKKDSLEFRQMSQSLQDKIDEANVQFLQYPYNVQKRTLKDSLSISLFGKTEELAKELHAKVDALPKMQEQAEKEVYEKMIAEDPQRFTEIYFTQNPSKKQEADKSYIECRCKYKERLAFDMAFIHDTLTDCDCREKEYQIVSEFFHSREDFDQMFNQEELTYKLELNKLKSMMADKKAIEEILFNSKQLNFKKSMLTSNEELKSVVNRINEHKGKYYYADVIDAVFKLNDKLAKEWEKNGKYFKSKAEMFEYWISEEYDKVLKARKKE